MSKVFENQVEMIFDLISKRCVDILDTQHDQLQRIVAKCQDEDREEYTNLTIWDYLRSTFLMDRIVMINLTGYYTLCRDEGVTLEVEDHHFKILMGRLLELSAYASLSLEA